MAPRAPFVQEAGLFCEVSDLFALPFCFLAFPSIRRARSGTFLEAQTLLHLWRVQDALGERHRIFVAAFPTIWRDKLVQQRCQGIKLGICNGIHPKRR